MKKSRRLISHIKTGKPVRTVFNLPPPPILIVGGTSASEFEKIFDLRVTSASEFEKIFDLRVTSASEFENIGNAEHFLDRKIFDLL